MQAGLGTYPQKAQVFLVAVRAYLWSPGPPCSLSSPSGGGQGLDCFLCCSQFSQCRPLRAEPAISVEVAVAGRPG